MRVLGISGSLRADSYNTKLLESATRVLPPDAEFAPLHTDVLRQLPHYDADLDTDELDDAAVAQLREAIGRADAILWITPEYNGGVPGAIKNALDWVSRPPARAAIKGKPSAVIGASTGSYGGVWAQDSLRRSLGIAGARVVDAEFAVPRAHEVYEQYADVLRPEDEPRLAEILESLVEEARINASLKAA